MNQIKDQRNTKKWREDKLLLFEKVTTELLRFQPAKEEFNSNESSEEIMRLLNDALDELAA